MKLLYVKEHLTCRNYVSDFHVGFQSNELEAGATVTRGDKYYNYIIFLLEGDAIVNVPDAGEQICHEGEIFFIARNQNYTLSTANGLRYLLLAFDNPVSFGTDLTMEDLQLYYKDDLVFHKLTMCEGTHVVVDTVSFYMHHKIQCKHLHVAKQQEVFMILSTFYTKEQLANFFNPILDDVVDFKAFIMNHYQDVKTVEELARACNSSVRSLTRKFHEHFGDSPYSWMLKQRSKHIRMKIEDPKIPFADIINEYGFSSPAHFTSFCKSIMAKVPAGFVKQ